MARQGVNNREWILLPPIKNCLISYRLLKNVRSSVGSRWPEERSLYDLVDGQVLPGTSQQHMVGSALRLLAVERQERVEQRSSS